MTEYMDYFSMDAVVGQLISPRLKLARRRRRELFLRAMGPGMPPPRQDMAGLGVGGDCLPPRSQWQRPSLKSRKGAGPEALWSDAIRMAVRKAVQAGTLEQHEWGRNLQVLVHRVREAALDPAAHVWSRPRIRLVPKEDSRKHRIVASFEDPVDRVLVGLTAKCLRDILDPFLLPSVYAYRPRSSFTHHAAVEAVLDFRMSRPGRPVYVAESDIKQFFDTVSHEVVRLKLDQVLARAGVSADTKGRIRAAVEGYLSSYSYAGVALPAARELLTASRAGGREPEVDTGAILADPADGDVCGATGIPQGGALSAILANLVLSEADEAVCGQRADERLFYARFCDDIIILHEDEDGCSAALGRYIEALRRLRLVAHDAVPISACDASYYNAKSKRPFPWACPGPGVAGIPWVSFLGYQIRHDGLLRVRRASLAKEARWQVEQVNRVIAAVRSSDAGTGPTPEDVVDRVSLRMACHATGRTGRTTGRAGRGHCWADGFRLLGALPHDESQLRWLDARRERQIRRLRRRMAALRPQEHPLPKDPRFRQGFYGSPFSYHAALSKQTGAAALPEGKWQSVYGA